MLGSGSAGNSALVATDHCKILINGGLSARQLVLFSGKMGSDLQGVLPKGFGIDLVRYF
jgi:hypothetical protein